jgi:hypothetical protein
MANDVTSERLWILDTVAVIKAVGNDVIVRKIVFHPAAIDNLVNIQEYSSEGVLRLGICLAANHSDINLVALDFGSEGRRLNGFKLSVLTAGVLDVYLGTE